MQSARKNNNEEQVRVWVRQEKKMKTKKHTHTKKKNRAQENTNEAVDQFTHQKMIIIDNTITQRQRKAAPVLRASVQIARTHAEDEGERRRKKKKREPTL